MRKHPSKGYWFAIRMGVEELNEPKPTDFGRKFLVNMKKEISKVIDELARFADFHIRRKYYLDVSKDSEILTTPKIVTNIASDMKSLLYFFELAHQS